MMKTFTRFALLVVFAGALYALSTPARADSFDENPIRERGKKHKPDPVPTPTPKPVGPREGGAGE